MKLAVAAVLFATGCASTPRPMPAEKPTTMVARVVVGRDAAGRYDTWSDFAVPGTDPLALRACQRLVERRVESLRGLPDLRVEIDHRCSTAPLLAHPRGPAGSYLLSEALSDGSIAMVEQEELGDLLARSVEEKRVRFADRPRCEAARSRLAELAARSQAEAEAQAAGFLADELKRVEQDRDRACAELAPTGGGTTDPYVRDELERRCRQATTMVEVVRKRMPLTTTPPSRSTCLPER